MREGNAVNEKRARFKTFKVLIKAGKSDKANIAKAAFTEAKRVAKRVV